MTDVAIKTDPKAKTGTATPIREAVAQAVKSEFPNFEVPNVASPAIVREWTEKGVAQAKDAFEKIKTAAEETTGLLEGSFATAARGSAEYGLKVLDILRANSNAQFDLAKNVVAAKSLAEIIEISTAHARRQFEALSSQTKELTALAQKVANDTAEPIKSSVAKVFPRS